MIRLLIERLKLFLPEPTNCQDVLSVVLFKLKFDYSKAFCICFYDAALWHTFSNGAILKLSSAYNKCMKSFFRFS